MFAAGLDVCRLNFSHGDLDGHAHALELVRSVAAECGQPICVVGDLCGPKIRLGRFSAGPVQLQVGQVIRFVRGTGECTGQQLTSSYPALVDEVAEGHRILIDDGRVRLTVRERQADASARSPAQSTAIRASTCLIRPCHCRL